MDDQQPTDNPPCPRPTWWRRLACAVLDHRLHFYDVQDDGVCRSFCTRCGWRPVAAVLILRPWAPRPPPLTRWQRFRRWLLGRR